MQFVFYGTVDELKKTIQAKAQALHKDIVIRHDVPDVLKIGFQRLGHNGGRFFVADILQEDNRITLSGDAVDIFPEDSDNRLSRVWSHMNTFLFLYLMRAFIPFVVWLFIHESISIWVPLLLPFPMMIFLALKKEKTNTDTDAAFYQFMSMVTSGEITIPSNSQELYQMLISTPGLHSLPQLNDDVITWELYHDVYVEAFINEWDTLINVVHMNMPHGSLMHWHPELEDMYEELLTLGKKGNILVLRRFLSGTEVYYLGKPEKFRFSTNKKWHWGKLIYLKQQEIT